MTAAGPGETERTDPLGMREERLRKVLLKVAEARCAGRVLTDEEVVTLYPDLLPQLADKLATLENIAQAQRQIPHSAADATIASYALAPETTTREGPHRGRRLPARRRGDRARRALRPPRRSSGLAASHRAGVVSLPVPRSSSSVPRPKQANNSSLSGE